MVKEQGPWGNQENENPWGDIDDTPSKAKVIDLPKIKKPKEVEFKFSWIIFALIGLWLASGFYQVQTGEQGVVLRFGAYTTTTDAGLHYHLPYPIEDIIKVNVSKERDIRLGGDTAYNAANTAGIRNANNYGQELNAFTESHMLTGDENIVDINLNIVWKVKDAKDY